MIEGALRLPLVTRGKIEESATRKPVDADDPAFRVDHAHRIVGAAHPAGAAGVIGALDMLADEGIELVVGLNVRCPARSRGRDRGRTPAGRKSRASAGCSGGNRAQSSGCDM